MAETGRARTEVNREVAKPALGGREGGCERLGERGGWGSKGGNKT